MPLEKELADASLEDKEPVAATSGEKAAHTEIKSIPANYTMIQVRLASSAAGHRLARTWLYPADSLSNPDRLVSSSSGTPRVRASTGRSLRRRASAWARWASPPVRPPRPAPAPELLKQRSCADDGRALPPLSAISLTVGSLASSAYQGLDH